MYVGTHYNSYYNSRFSGTGSVYQRMTASKANHNWFSGSAGGLSATRTQNSFSANNETVHYVKTLKESAADIKKAANSLSNGTAFRQKTAISSDEQAMTVKVSSSRYYHSADQNADVTIDQIAQGQENKGTALKSSERAGLTGNQQIALEVGGVRHQISFIASANDTNAQIQAKMAEAINKKGIGVSATVSTDGGMTTLTLASKETGSDRQNTFSIRDVSGNGVEKMGVAGVTKEAQDAIYSVNGGANRTSKTNTVDLGNGLTATLKKAGEETIHVTTGVDKKQAVTQMRELKDAYNAMYGEAMDKADSDDKAQKLFSKLLNTSKIYMSSLTKVGVGFDRNGFMTLDEDKLSTAIEDGSLESLVEQGSRSNYGFMNALSRLASDVELNTQRYVDKTSFGQPNLFGSSLYNISQMRQYGGFQPVSLSALFDLWL